MGAFEYGAYRRGQDGKNDPRLLAAITAIKKELIYNGYGEGIDLTVTHFGATVEKRLKEFQASRLITPVDGKAGMKTLMELFRKRVQTTETKYELSSGSIGKLLKLESGYDPVALGYVDPDDTGIAQINLRIHSSISVAQAYDPAFAIDWTGRYLSGQYDAIASRANVMKAARAAYNVGNGNAYNWMMDGFPPSGGPLLNGEDVYTRATRYIELIDKQVW